MSGLTLVSGLLGFRGPPPVVTSSAPAYGPEAGATAITITGTGFFAGATVTVGGVAATSVIVVGSTSITCTTPAGSFGAANIVVTNTDAQAGTGTGAFNYYKLADFNALTAGSMTSAALVAARPMVSTFTRAETTTVISQATCQTSASTLESGVLLNKPRIDNNGTVKGLLIEQRMTNLVPFGGARKITTGWVASAQGTQTVSVATGPDGTATACSQCNMATTNNISNYQDFGSDTVQRYCFSSWQRSVNSASNGDMQMVDATAADTVWAATFAVATNTWARLVKAKGATGMRYFRVVDTYDRSTNGGQTARARNVYVDFIQTEPGDWPTSAINTTGAAGAYVARPSDYLGIVLSTATNRIRLYMRMYPIFATATSMQSTNAATNAIFSPTTLYLYYIDANNYMYMKDSDKKLYCKVAGSAELASTNAVSFTNADDVEFLIEVGNNVASVLKYRVNAGAWTDLVMSTFSGSATPAGDASICNSTAAVNSDGQAFPCRLRELRAYPVDVATTDL